MQVIGRKQKAFKKENFWPDDTRKSLMKIQLIVVKTFH